MREFLAENSAWVGIAQQIVRAVRAEVFAPATFARRVARGKTVVDISVLEKSARRVAKGIIVDTSATAHHARQIAKDSLAGLNALANHAHKDAREMTAEWAATAPHVRRFVMDLNVG